MVGLRRNIPHELFPQLNAAGRLVALDWSFWKDPPVVEDGNNTGATSEDDNENRIGREEGSGDIVDMVEEQDQTPDTEHSSPASSESHD